MTTETIVVDEKGLRRIDKDPSAVLDYSWDWTAWLALINDAYSSKVITVSGVTLDSSSVMQASTTLSGSITSGAATITVGSTADFTPSGALCIGTVPFSYTGKTATTFTGCSGTPAASNGDTVKQTVITAWLSGGTAAQVATAAVKMTTVGGRTDERTLYLDVADR